MQSTTKRITSERIFEMIHNLARKLGKKPEEITRKDFRDNGLGGMLHFVFKNRVRAAVEFAFLDIYPEYRKKQD